MQGERGRGGEEENGTRREKWEKVKNVSRGKRGGTLKHEGEGGGGSGRRGEWGVGGGRRGEEEGGGRGEWEEGGVGSGRREDRRDREGGREESRKEEESGEMEERRGRKRRNKNSLVEKYEVVNLLLTCSAMMSAVLSRISFKMAVFRYSQTRAQEGQ